MFGRAGLLGVLLNRQGYRHSGRTMGAAIASGLLVAAARAEGGGTARDDKVTGHDLQRVLGVSLASGDLGSSGKPLGTAGLATSRGTESDGSGPVAFAWGMALALLLAASSFMLLRRRRGAHAQADATPGAELPPAPWEDAEGGSPKSK
jgi:hypothetical protein